MTAEDIVQNIFIQIWQQEKLNKIHHPERFLLRSVKFKCIDYLRTKRHKNLVDLSHIEHPNLQIPSEITEEDIDPLLHYFAAKLPIKTRQVFLKSRVDGKTYKVIAQEMNITVKTVENQMGRALRHMRELLKEHNFLSLLF